MSNPFSFNYNSLPIEVPNIIKGAWDGMTDAINAIYDSGRNTADLKEQYQIKEKSASYWAAGSSFVMWWLVNAHSYFSSGAQLNYGTSWNNPFIIPLSAEDKKRLIANGLGVNADSQGMCRSYGALYSGTCQPGRYADLDGSNGLPPGIQLSLFNLGLCNPDDSDRQSGRHAFEWQNNGDLWINDRYNFDSGGDFSISGTSSGVVGLLVFVAGVVSIGPGLLNNLQNGERAEGIWNQWKKTPLYDPRYDPTPRFDEISIGGIPVSVQSMYTRIVITPSELLQSNPPLFWDGVSKKKIPQSAIAPAISAYGLDQSIEVGTKQPSPILGFPRYLPNTIDIGKDPNNWSYGSSDVYPRPFTSFTQQLVNSTFILGPYAKLTGGGIQLNLNGFVNPYSPVTGLDNYALECDPASPITINVPEGIPGRLLTVISGPYIGDLGFCHQPWDTFADGPYNTDTGTAGGTPFDSKAVWWTKCATTIISARWVNMPGYPLVKVAVAYRSSTTSSADLYNPNYPISAQPDLSVLLSVVLAASIF